MNLELQLFEAVEPMEELFLQYSENTEPLKIQTGAFDGDCLVERSRRNENVHVQTLAYVLLAQQSK